MTDILDDGGIPSPARAQIGAGVRARLERNPMVSRIDSDRLDIFGRQGFLSREECAGLRAIIAIHSTALGPAAECGLSHEP